MGIGCISQQTKNVKSRMAEVAKSRNQSLQASVLEHSQVQSSQSKIIGSPLLTLSKQFSEQKKQIGSENRAEKTVINQIIQQAPSSQEIDQQNERIVLKPFPQVQKHSFSIKPQRIPVQDFIIREERLPLRTMNQSFNNTSRLSNRSIDYAQFNIKLQPLPTKGPVPIQESQEDILDEQHINQISINLYRTELKY